MCRVYSVRVSAKNEREIRERSRITKRMREREREGGSEYCSLYKNNKKTRTYLAFAERQIGFTILGGIEVVTGCHQQGRSPPLIGCDELLKLPRASTDVCVPSISFEETVIIAI